MSENRDRAIKVGPTYFESVKSLALTHTHGFGKVEIPPRNVLDPGEGRAGGSLITATSPPPARSDSFSSVYGSYLFLLHYLDKKYIERGILDPLTWIEVDLQLQTDNRLSVGQVMILHGHCENRLRLAGGMQ